MILSVAADVLQIFVFPLFAEGALSPADDVLDLAVAAILVRLLGWHCDRHLRLRTSKREPYRLRARVQRQRLGEIQWKQTAVTDEHHGEAQVIEGEDKSSS
jgi:hypothetical protein